MILVKNLSLCFARGGGGGVGLQNFLRSVFGEFVSHLEWLSFLDVWPWVGF